MANTQQELLRPDVESPDTLWTRLVAASASTTRETVNAGSLAKTGDVNAPWTLPRFRSLKEGASKVFTSVYEWEGEVRSVDVEGFTAELIPLRQDPPRADIDLAKIPWTDVSRGDRSKIEPGVIFRYLVGYSKSDKGTVERRRHVYVRRASKKKANKLGRWLSIASKLRGQAGI